MTCFVAWHAPMRWWGVCLAFVAAIGCGNSTRPFAAVEALCASWCENPRHGASCCRDADCGQACIDDCVQNTEDSSCGNEFIAARLCQLAAVCNDFSYECRDALETYWVCVNRQEAPQLCESVASLCEVGRGECIDAFDLEPWCALSWWSIATCIDEQAKNSCAACTGTVSSLPGCDLPAGRTRENYGEDPPGCLTLDPPPDGCGTRCPSGNDEDCASATHCSDRNLCEADCISGDDCSSDEICVDRGRCFAAPNCVDLPSPPPGCGALCPGRDDTECEMQTYCGDDGLCEADCTRDTECAPEQICTLRGRCLPRPNCLDLRVKPFGCGEPCPSGRDTDCGPEWLSETFCSSTGLCDAECFLNRDCGEEEVCSDGRCQPFPTQ